MLPSISQLISHLNARRIRYCHWKSNEHLAASLAGLTDLDILFDASRRHDAMATLSDCRFRQFRAVWFRRYSDIDDFLTIDPTTGRIVHVHAHWLLNLGESWVKSFHLPWESSILDAATPDMDTAIMLPDPAHELLLLVIRSAIKQHYSLPDRGARSAGAHELSHAQREFDWLTSRVSHSSFVDATTLLIDASTATAISHIYSSGLCESALNDVYNCLGPFLNSHRRMTALRARATQRFRRSTLWFVAGLNRRIAPWRLAQKRVALRRGFTVAIIGADGTGKSTLVRALEREFLKKIDVSVFYLGARLDTGMRIRRLAAQFLTFIDSRTSRSSAANSSVPARPERTAGLPVRSLRMLLEVLLVIERRARLRAAAILRSRGVGVLLERFPQSSTALINDGPRLDHLCHHQSLILRCVGRWERRQYDHTRMPRPDLVIRLHAPVEILSHRRPDDPPERLALKQQALLALRFPKGIDIVELDATLDAQAVFVEAMNALATHILPPIDASSSSLTAVV